MSTGIHGHGSAVYFGSTSPTSATAIANLTSISGPELSMDAIEISTMDSTNKWREFIKGMRDAGEITLELNFDGTTVASYLNTEFASTATSTPFSLQFSDTDTASFSGQGMITALGHTIPYDDKITQSVTLKITGTPTFSAA